MPQIQLLPDWVVNQIAAGEVIERPASAVKELVENSLDAKATQIKISVQKGGKDLIQISDNGCGIEPEEIGSVTKGATVPTSQASANALCYFVSGIGAKAAQVYGNPMVNGTVIGELYNKDIPLPAKADGGYYVYVPGYAMFNVPTTAASDIAAACK